MIIFRDIVKSFGTYLPEHRAADQGVIIESAQLISGFLPDYEPNTLYIGSSLYIPVDYHKNELSYLCITEPDEALPDCPSNVKLLALHGSITLREVYDTVQEQLISDRRYTQCHRRLFDALLDGADIQQLADTAYEVLGNPFFLFDANLNVLCGRMDQTHDKIDLSFWHGYIDNGYMPTNEGDYFKKFGLFKAIERNQKPFITKDGIRDTKKIIGRLSYGSQILGFVIIAELGRPFRKEDIAITELLCHVLALRMKLNPGTANSKEYADDFLLTDILLGKLRDNRQIRERMAYFDWKERQFNQILAIGAKLGQLERLAMSKIRSLIQQIFPYSKMATIDRYIVVLLSGESGTGLISDGQKAELRKCLNQNQLLCGISDIFSDISESRCYYEQCLSAVDLGNKIEPGENVFFFAQYAMYHVILTLAQAGELRKFCHTGVLKLWAHDRENQSELTHTLYTWLTHDRNVVRSASALKIHRNTMNYRLERIAAIGGSILEETNSLDRMLFTCRALEMVSNDLLTL